MRFELSRKPLEGPEGVAGPLWVACGLASAAA
jgi:hypothetical protein